MWWSVGFKETWPPEPSSLTLFAWAPVRLRGDALSSCLSVLLLPDISDWDGPDLTCHKQCLIWFFIYLFFCRNTFRASSADFYEGWLPFCGKKKGRKRLSFGEKAVYSLSFQPIASIVPSELLNPADKVVRISFGPLYSSISPSFLYALFHPLIFIHLLLVVAQIGLSLCFVVIRLETLQRGCFL